MLTKGSLRREYKKLRLELSDEEVNLLNEQLIHQAQEFDWSNLSYIHVYIPIQKFKEPDTLLLERIFRDRYVDTHLVISRSDLLSNKMDHFVWEKDHLLELNQWGISEPVSGTPVFAEQLDAVIVPLLAFDQQGHRVGYGKGFYDRFLSACRPDCLKIGMSFFGPVSKIEDIEPSDVALDFCITPQRIWDFRVNKSV